MPDLSVILVSFNDWDHLEKCLDSLRAFQSRIDTEIVVLDNNSSDGSPDFVRRRFPEVKLVCNSENKGFARASNLGIRASTGEFVLFLNTDTVADAEAVIRLLENIRQKASIGAVGPALMKDRRTYQISFGRKVDFFSQLVQKAFFNLYYSRKLKRDKEIREVGWLSGACLMARRKALEEVGGFDENYFLYFEDIDLCYRIREKGWTLQYCPEAHILHIGGTSASLKKKSIRYQYRKSQLYFYRKHTSGLSQKLLRLYLRLNFIFSALLFWRRDGGDSGPIDFFGLLGKQEK